MTATRKFGFTTRQLHSAAVSDPATGAFAVPLYQTAGFQFSDTEYAARLFNLQEQGHIYSRISNPTNAVFEQRLADLEAGVAAIATASGHAAQATVIFTLCQAGDHIVSSAALYGGTISQFRYLPRWASVTLVDARPREIT
jgi:O-acetylhomoserine (thiol)-lyase